MNTSGAPPRDTAPSPFAEILTEVVARVPGALGAALTDEEGECVDYTGLADPFDLKVAAAHFTIVLAEAAARVQPLGALRTVLVRASKRSFLVHALHDKYALVMLLRGRTAVAATSRALGLCERALAAEAGWPAPAGPYWYPIHVESRGRRPARIASAVSGPRTRVHGPGAPRMHGLEVLGAVVPAVARERAFRVRLDGGAELTIVREAGGAWYADEALPTARPHDEDA